MVQVLAALAGLATVGSVVASLLYIRLKLM
jgi:hypothetical protein